MRVLCRCLLRCLLAGWGFIQSGLVVADCVLIPFKEQLQIAELHVDEPQYADRGYRRRLLRFVNDYYSDIAEDLLRGRGEYLDALNRLMGSNSDTCTVVYREMLVQEVNSQDFALALWTLRAAENAQTWAVQESAALIQIKNN